MLAYRLSIVLFVLSLLATFFFANDLKFALYLGIVFLFLIALTVGSAKIQLGFYKKAFCRKKTNEKVIAITFDDGPDKNTNEILKLLKSHNARATFFCIGNKVAPHAANLKKMVDNGHLIGNHSFEHRSFFPVLRAKRMAKEIMETNERIEAITGQKPNFFRPPFGVTNPRVARTINKTGMSLVGWSIRSYDTVSVAKERILKRIVRRVAPGKIILLHDTSTDILWLLDELLKHLKNEGYSLVTVDELKNL